MMEGMGMWGGSHTPYTRVYLISCRGSMYRNVQAHISPHSTTKGKGPINGPPSRPDPQPSPTGGPNIGAVQQTWGVSGVTDILLDVRTAGNDLHISHDGKTASSSSDRIGQKHQRGFLCPQVMSSQSFSSGRHYWDMDVG
ncbi:unnamed protein product, partial [Staurois parvus]